MQESSTTFDKMPTEGIDLGGLKQKAEEAAKPITENIDEKDKQGMKDQAGEVLKKPTEVIKTAGAIVNSPEAHIVAKAAGGSDGEKGLKQTQDVVNTANDVVGNAQARF